jgi:hypothetical protein
MYEHNTIKYPKISNIKSGISFLIASAFNYFYNMNNNIKIKVVRSIPTAAAQSRKPRIKPSREQN